MDSPKPTMKTPLDSLSPIANFLARHAHLIALALFAAVGAAILDDYGVAHDETTQRRIGYASLNYILGDEDALIESHSDRYYGVAFEIPLVAVERLLRLEDARAIYLSRHLLTHLFFLAGGFFAWLLAYRLFGSRLVALLAMLIFLLHPRMYAHSFFNSKDLPFLSMFMVALYLAHRAFRRDSVWAFALFGVGAGLLANIRIMGFMLPPAVLGMLALDIFRAARREGWGGVKPPLANAAAFIAAFAAALYAAWPLLWRDPSEMLEAFRVLSRHPVIAVSLLRGELVWHPNIPWDYIPTWALATTPPAALAAAALGIAYLARLCAANWRGIFANSTARFGLLATACLIMPVAAAIALESNLYDDWRQMYFLYAPLCVLAAFGLRFLAAIPKPRLRAAACALAALGIAAAAVQMVQLHPHQHEYFSPLLNKRDLADRWLLDYWGMSRKEALETLLETRPDDQPIFVDQWRNAQILPAEDRRRLAFSETFPQFRIVFGNVREGDDAGDGGDAAIWRREIYGAPLVAILDVRAESEAAHRAAYMSATASEPDATAGGFDMYAQDGTLTYVKSPCAESDARGRFALTVFPDQIAEDAGHERESVSFAFAETGALFDGKCVIVRDLPDYPISHLATERWLPGEGELWSAYIPFAGYGERFEAALSELSGDPAAVAGGFDIYAQDGTLTYVKTGCAESDARGRFALAVFPIDPADLPRSARDAGADSESLNFDFHQYGAIFDGKCVIIRDLPGYPASHIETAQWIPGESALWSARIRFAGYEDRFRRALSELPGAPAASAGGFDIYLDGGTLTYVKTPCAESDTRGRFELSVYPADPSDAPDAMRAQNLNHVSLNFDFHRYGAIFDGKCAVIRSLPDYPISHIAVGQWIPGERELWSAEIDVGE